LILGYRQSTSGITSTLSLSDSSIKGKQHIHICQGSWQFFLKAFALFALFLPINSFIYFLLPLGFALVFFFSSVMPDVPLEVMLNMLYGKLYC
jgi:hypothetical protein